MENRQTLKNNSIRDYNKEPLIIKNSFITYLNDLSVMLLINSIMIFCIFYSGAIDWSNREYSEIIIKELRNPRLSTAILIISSLTIITIISIAKKIINPKKIYFYDNKIFFDYKNTNIQKADILNISKSIYPVLGKKIDGFFGQIGLILAALLIFITHFFTILIKLFISLLNKEFKFKLFCNIAFYDDKNKVINLYLTSKKDYDELNKYLSQNFNLQIENLDKNYKFYK